MRILIVDDEARFAAVLGKSLALAGQDTCRIAASAEAAIVELDQEPADLVLTDLRLPGSSGLDLLAMVVRRWPTTPVILMTAFADVETAKAALKRGALDYLVKPFPYADLAALVEQARARPDARRDDQGIPRLAGLVGGSPAMRKVFAELSRAAASEASVLLLGESGTGKEVAARAVHTLSPRHSEPFIEVHTAALPEGLVESELFGHERGSFTGADSRKHGLVEAADGGTLFLDEIGDMPAAAQAKLLRFLQERRFFRVGGIAPVTVDVRVVAATNRDLPALVRAGKFREDLFYRLDVMSIVLPRLADRTGDIAVLTRFFLAQQGGRTITPEAQSRLGVWNWPGNVRELANVLERAGILAGSGTIGEEHLPDRLRAHPSESVVGDPTLPHLEDGERQLVRSALAQAAGNKTRAAELLGITRRRLYSRLRALGLDDGELSSDV